MPRLYIPQKTKFIIAIVIIILIAGSLGYLVYKRFTEKIEGPKAINLTVWRLWDDKENFEGLIKKFQQQYPNVKVTYIKKEWNGYEEEFVEAMAEGRAPDIISIHNTWIPKHKAKLQYCPPDIFSGEEFESYFVDATHDDLLRVEKVKDPKTGKLINSKVAYAMPLSVDSLALFYNKDLFKTAHLITLPETWQEVSDLVPKFTKIGDYGKIEHSAVALGTSENISSASDILQLMMMQKGSVMVDTQNYQVNFNLVLPGEGWQKDPGTSALRFYTSFANPSSANYNYNSALSHSTDLFAQERVAMIFGYSYLIDTLREKAPNLNYGIAYMPQEEEHLKEVNFADYWPLAVTRSSRNPKTAWLFLKFLAENSEDYYQAANLPPARKDLVNMYDGNERLEVFSKQALTAKSWYQIDNLKIKSLFNKMINDVILEGNDIEKTLAETQEQVQFLMDRDPEYEIKD
ncbi:hypothetical protein COY23_00905 [bacterium (Candidatus Torokbacteria) CG_4_10_14_0_2_um_filter_35_8]|nr:MAG: hypothetical protein COY23_00905 [bacterium (Candidatus Torokbacteria) CG_4_10_14_0_2_um_filter_35_8]